MLLYVVIIGNAGEKVICSAAYARIFNWCQKCSGILIREGVSYVEQVLLYFVCVAGFRI